MTRETRKPSRINHLDDCSNTGWLNRTVDFIMMTVTFIIIKGTTVEFEKAGMGKDSCKYKTDQYSAYHEKDSKDQVSITRNLGLKQIPYSPLSKTYDVRHAKHNYLALRRRNAGTETKETRPQQEWLKANETARTDIRQ